MQEHGPHKPRLHIAVTADPELPVPPRHYGGAERIVHMLVEGLHARGHDVTLFAHPESQVSCRLVPYPGRTGQSSIDIVRNASTIAAHVLGSKPDLVHSYGRLATLAPLASSRVPKIMSYGRAITPRSIRLARRLFGRSISFTACARHMIGQVESLAPWHVIYNAVPAASYTYRADVAADAPLVFLGRLERIKGPHLAVDAALKAGRTILLAGNVAAEHQAFFDREIRPRLDDDRARYVGPVDDRQKNELLGRAAALLMPILWDEPFGMVMAESLACGTPVIGFDRASVPEVITDGINGFVTSDGDVEAMAAAVARLDAIERRACRATFEGRFSDEVIVGQYESLYFDLCRATRPLVAVQRASSEHRTS
jgi:glycosyltransferase involved in cell wall biosynthesis